jgi:hypothetical protein
VSRRPPGERRGVIEQIVGAVPTDLRHSPTRVVVTPADAPNRPRGVERREATADDHFHADHGPPAAPLGPPASESPPTYRGRDHGHSVIFNNLETGIGGEENTHCPVRTHTLAKSLKTKKLMLAERVGFEPHMAFRFCKLQILGMPPIPALPWRLAPDCTRTLSARRNNFDLKTTMRCALSPEGIEPPTNRLRVRTFAVRRHPGRLVHSELLSLRARYVRRHPGESTSLGVKVGVR